MLEKRVGTIHHIVIALIDAFLVNLGYYLAFQFRFENIPAANFADYVKLIPWIIITAFIIFKIYGLYDIERKTFTELLFTVILSLIMIMVFTMALTFFYRGFAFPRSVFAIGAVIQVILIALWKGICLIVIKHLHGVQKVLLVGSREEAYKVARKFQDMSRGWFEAKYIIDEENINHITDAISMVDIVCLCPGLSQELKNEISVMALEKRRKIFLIPELYEVFLAKSSSTQIGDIPVFELIDLTLTAEQMIIKRILDVIVSVIGLIISFPIMLLIAILIKLTSPGPVFYTQERVGLFGKTFMLYKFRTMINNAEKFTGPVLATEKDPRITPIGRILRATRLDELPQLINVFKGEMSMVGPRPERPFFVKQFKQENPHYKYRHIVKPGITGLAQVLGRYSTSADDKLRYDLIYIRNYSFLLDLRILFLTIKVVFMKDSSKGINESEDCENSLLAGIEILTHDNIAAAREK
ncbi:MAG: hypothetical protein PWQ60_607 [Thermoanaerobacteraceae bacterium]|nr:hypothetical protein [Thermoanaerobacteraceae bacterium]